MLKLLRSWGWSPLQRPLLRPKILKLQRQWISDNPQIEATSAAVVVKTRRPVIKDPITEIRERIWAVENGGVFDFLGAIYHS